jgi:hypothetical protein
MKAARLLKKSANHHEQVGLPHSFFLSTGPFAVDHTGISNNLLGISLINSVVETQLA